MMMMMAFEGVKRMLRRRTKKTKKIQKAGIPFWPIPNLYL
jgi:hypothetical protein